MTCTRTLLRLSLAMAPSLGWPTEPPTTSACTSETLQTVTVSGRLQPAGLQVDLARSRRWGSDPNLARSLACGWRVAANPSFAQAGLFLEAEPTAFAQFRLQGEALRFLGRRGSVLSFDSPRDRVDSTVLAQRGSEGEATWGSRFLGEVTLRAKLGPVILRSTSGWARNHFIGRGPWFYEPDADTLLPDGGHLRQHRLQALAEPAPRLWVGPVAEWQQVQGTHLRRRRLGLMAFWEADRPAGWGRPQLYFSAGRNLQDPNRQGRWWAVAAVGFRSATPGPDAPR